MQKIESLQNEISRWKLVKTSQYVIYGILYASEAWKTIAIIRNNLQSIYMMYQSLEEGVQKVERSRMKVRDGYFQKLLSM